jgi:uncharacterized protein (DUF849 family)
MTGGIQRIKSCLNGRRSPADHPAVPVRPDELATAAAAAVAAGAEAVHLHARDADGAESVAAPDIGRSVAAVREACPGVPVGVSTGLWITSGDEPARRAAVAGWAALAGEERPDFASVNVSEPGWVEVAGLLRGAGVAVEAGVWSVADARALAAQPADGWLRIMVEVMGGDPGGAAASADEILAELDAAGLAAMPRLLHGEGPTCWPLVRHAGRLGLPTRAGLEDSTTGPDGEPVSGNAELVALALGRWTAAIQR